MKDKFISVRITDKKKEEIKKAANKTYRSTGGFLLYCYEEVKRLQKLNSQNAPLQDDVDL
jgi:uncharacterized protein (DUF1778 family)